MSVGVALGGGSVKAAFHIGVLMALEEANIDVDFVSGTSSGAIVASLYAIGFSPSSILNIFNFYGRRIVGVDGKSVLKAMLNANKGARCINKFDNLEGILRLVFKSRGVFDIREVTKKLAVCSVDANLGKVIYFVSSEVVWGDKNEVTICGGALHKIVRASCAYPILFEPSLYKGRVLVDGGVMNNLPVRILKDMGADRVIALDVSNDVLPLSSLSMLNIGFRCVDIMSKCASASEIKNADLVIRPSNIHNVGMFDFNSINALANEGYCVGKNLIKKL